MPYDLLYNNSFTGGMGTRLSNGHSYIALALEQ